MTPIFLPDGAASRLAQRPLSTAPGAGGPTGGAAVQGASPFASLLHGLGAEVDRGERLARAAMETSRRAAVLGPADLIALQAGVYRYSEVLELAARLVDRSANAVKTVLQSP
jgi:hypothetical protein